MSRSINKVILVGNVGRDPEMRYTQSGTAVANFSVATNERWTDRDGNPQERTEWHRVVAWARLAEIVGEWVKKGTQVYVEGKIRTRQWEDRDGNTRYTTEIIADEMIMMGRGDGSAGGPGGPSDDYGPSDSGGGGGSAVTDDDIPF